MNAGVLAALALAAIAARVPAAACGGDEPAPADRSARPTALALVHGAPRAALAAIAEPPALVLFAGSDDEARAARVHELLEGASVTCLAPGVTAEELDRAAGAVARSHTILLTGPETLRWLELLEPWRHPSALMRELDAARRGGKRILLGATAASVLARAVVLPASAYGPIARNPRERDDEIALARGLEWIPLDVVEHESDRHGGIARAAWALRERGRTSALVLCGDVVLTLDESERAATVAGDGAAVLLEGRGSRRQRTAWDGAHISVLREGDAWDLARDALALAPERARAAASGAARTVDVGPLLRFADLERALAGAPCPERIVLAHGDESVTLELARAETVGRAGPDGPPTLLRAPLAWRGAAHARHER